MNHPTCKVCGKVDKFDFHVSNEVWTKVVPPIYTTKVVCLSCFDGFAQEKGVKYADSLRRVYFAGSQASFEFGVTARSD